MQLISRVFKIEILHHPLASQTVLNVGVLFAEFLKTKDKKLHIRLSEIMKRVSFAVM